MITVKDRSTGHLFDMWDHIGPKRRKLLDSSWAGVFRKFLLEKLPVSRIVRYFTEGTGRPSKELYTMIGALILQQLHDLSDPDVTRAVAFNIDWHYALDITDDSDAGMYVSERSLRNYRRMIIDEGLDRVLFEMLTDTLITAFGVDTSKQRLDSTHIQSNMRTLGRIRMFAVTIRKFLKKLARVHADVYAACLGPEFTDRYLSRDSGACFSRVKPSEAAKTLQQVSEDLLFLIEHFRTSDAVCALPEYKLLERVLREQCTVAGSGADALVTVKPPKEVSPDCLQNPSDPDAGYDAYKGSGYQAQVMETYQTEQQDPPKPNLITHVEAEPAHEHDSHALQPALDATANRDCCPTELLCDTLYGSDDNVQEAADKGVAVIAPVQGPAPASTITLGHFSHDPATNFITRCPEGHAPEKVRRTKKKRICATFSRETCRNCPRRSDCPVRLGRKKAPLYYDDAMLRCAQRRIHEQTPEFTGKYRWRSGIEGTNSHLKSDTGAARLRVRGMPAVRFAVTLKALGLNIMRCAKAMKICLAGEIAILCGQKPSAHPALEKIRFLLLVSPSRYMFRSLNSFTLAYYRRSA
jgi:hypothetical protein